MSSWAEEMIIRELKEENKIGHKKVLLKDKPVHELKEKNKLLGLRLFPHMKVDDEWFWKIIAYAYFACRTLGLLILIDVFIFKSPNIILFIIIFICCYYLNQKFYKIFLKKKNSSTKNIFIEEILPRGI